MSAEMLCPKCGEEAPYILATAGGRGRFRCHACACDFTETSHTYRRGSKMGDDKWAAIAAGLGRGLSLARISRDTGINYKTIWFAAKRINANAG